MLPDMLSQAKSLLPELIRIRRYLHQYPELAFREERTSRFLAEELARLGLEVKRGVGGTGLVGLLRTPAAFARGEGWDSSPPGSSPPVTVALRAEMDAVPVPDRKEVPYASRLPEVAHACGHDAHMACLLGAATLLASRKERLAGNVALLFQPAEEINQGALAMIRDGALADPPVDAILALHVSPELPAGKVAIKEGPVMAAEDNFTLRITGSSTHAATPHKGVDAIVAAALLILSLQTLVSREIDPVESAVLTVSTIHGGTGRNVVCESVEVSGTVRTISPGTRQRMADRIRGMTETLAAGYGVGADLQYERANPPVVNDRYLASMCREAARTVLGEEGLGEVPLAMVSEDFAHFLQHVPGVYLWLGTKRPNTPGGPVAGTPAVSLHSPTFDLDETALAVGAAVLAQSTLLLLDRLAEEKERLLGAGEMPRVPPL